MDFQAEALGGSWAKQGGQRVKAGCRVGSGSLLSLSERSQRTYIL